MDASNSESQPPAGPGTGVDGGKTPKKGKDDGPSINVTMPSKEWIDDLWGPMMIVEEDENDEQNQNTSTESKSRSRTPQLATTISTNTRPKSKSNKAHDVVVISDDEEEKEKNNQTVKSNENMELEIIENPNNTGKRNGHLSDEFSTREENIDNENKAKPSEIRQIVLTRAQISQFAKCNNALFRKAVIGCYVRFNAPSILPDKSKDLLFLDQIIDILEPQSYQHFWFNRRFRLKYFGDFQIEQIHELAIQKDTELRAWFCCMEAKGIPIPSHEFVKRKKLELLAAQKEIETKNIAPTPTKTRITRTDLSKIVLNQDTLSSLSKLPFEQFKKAVVGNFVCIQALRTGMPDDCQYHIIRVADCTQRREEYKVGNISIVNYQLVLPFYGNYIIPWLRTNFKEVTDAGFRRWIDDMKSWNQPIPTVAEINEKAAELQMALTEAESIPDYAQKKKKQKEEEEKQKRANLPIRFAIDLDKNLLKQQNLQKLAILAQKDFDLFEKTMVGSFVRLKVGAKQFQVDRIRALELVELKPPIQNEEDEIIFDEKWEPTFEEKVSIELKYGGGTSLKELIGNSSAFNIAQTEFDEWLRKMHDDPLCRPIPTYALIEKKEEENNRALELAEKLAAEQKKSNESTNTTQSKNKSRNVDEEVRILGTSNNGAALLPKIPKKPINEDGGRSRGGGPSYSQPNQWKPRREVRETPGIRSGWMNSTTSSSSTIAPLRQQWQRQTGQNEFNRPQRWTTPQPLSQRLISEPNQINFVRERNPWVPSGEQHQQIQNLLNSRLSRYDQPSGPPPAMAIPGQSPAAFFGTSRNNIANSANNEQIQMERSLGFYHDQFGRIGSNPAVASSSTAFAASDDALRRAIPNDRLPQLINQRGLSSSMSSSSAGYAAHYNAAPSYTQPTFFSSAAPKRARQSSPQAPPVHRIF